MRGGLCCPLGAPGVLEAVLHQCRCGAAPASPSASPAHPLAEFGTAGTAASSLDLGWLGIPLPAALHCKQKQLSGSVVFSRDFNECLGFGGAAAAGRFCVVHCVSQGLSLERNQQLGGVFLHFVCSQNGGIWGPSFPCAVGFSPPPGRAPSLLPAFGQRHFPGS